MSIIRIGKRKRRGFTMVDNFPIEDSNLRWEALGVLVYLLSKPEGWEVNVNHLWKLNRGAGRDKMYKILRELEEAGYFRSERIRRPDGTFYWVKTVYEDPQLRPPDEPASPLPENQEMEAQPLPEIQEVEASPLPEKPDPDFQEVDTLLLVNTDLVNTSLPSRDQQQQGYNNDKGTSDEKIVVVAEDFSLGDAFRLAGIKARTARRIPDAWKQATGADIAPEDVLAWHLYREAENLNLPAGRKLRPAFVIASLESGDRADEEFYERAREYLADLQAEQAVEDLDASAEPVSPELLGLRRALEAYVPPAAEIGLEALDAISRRLPDVAEALHAQGMTPEDLNDLRLYLIYTNQPVPRPNAVAETLAGVGPEFQNWRERKAEAERLWRHIVQQSSMATPGSAIDQAMKRAMPVDLNGSLVVMGSTDLQLYFQRIWQQKSATILSGTDFPKDLPIQFIPQS